MIDKSHLVGRPLICLESCQSIHPDFKLAEPASLEILPGECTAIVGPNGSGKSKLVDMLLSGHPLCRGVRNYNFSPRVGKAVSSNIKYLEFRDITDGAEYYQQRWNQNDISDSPLVGDIFEESCRKAVREYAGISVYDSFIVRDETQEQKALREARNAELMREATEAVEEMKTRLERLFHLEELKEKRVILLSSGEMRKFQIARMLLGNPRVFMVDNPFIGLDSAARTQFNVFLSELSRNSDFTLVLVLSREDEIPDYVTHIIPMREQKVLAKRTHSEYMAAPFPSSGLAGGLPSCVPSSRVPSSRILDDNTRRRISELPVPPATYEGDEVLSLRKVCIRYGGRFILKNLDLTVRKGECWAVRGANGSGKTTLLSIINGDNPQSYANDITLFGCRRGSGESIWDIKRHIGFVSPEMHRFFLKDISVLDTVAGGLSDALGRFRQHTPAELDRCRFWLSVFGLEDCAGRSFIRLSSGEQRLVLLARAFVKDPELLILDEPLHGLDCSNRARVRDIIDTFCHRDGKTLLMVTHYEDELPPCVTHTLVLQNQVRIHI